MSDQPKPEELRDYHDVPFPEGTQPTGEWECPDCHTRKTMTGEWTVEQMGDHAFDLKCGDKILWTFATEPPARAIADAHNAALTAARKGGVNDTLTACEGQVRHLEAQLAAERGNGQELMKMHREAVDKCNEARRQLAEEQDEHGRITANIAMEVQRKAHQLTDERKKRKDSDEHFKRACKQLAAERRAAEVEINEGVAVRDINHLNRIDELEKQLAAERNIKSERDELAVFVEEWKHKAQHAERELQRSVGVERELIKQLNAEREKADNLFKVSRKHCVENQELKKQLDAEHTNAEAWRLLAKGKEGAYVKMMQVSEVAAKQLAIAKITQEVLRSVPAALKQEIEQLDAALAAERERVQRLEKLLRSMPKSFGITENDLK